MRLVQFNHVMIRQHNDGIQVATMPITVQPELVGAVLPEMIPSELTASDGTPIGKVASSLLIGGARILVDATKEVAEYNLMNGSYQPPKPEEEKASEGGKILA